MTVDEITDGAASGRLSEAFGTGTAAVVSPVGQFTYRDHTVTLSDNRVGPLTMKFFDALTGIQYGRRPDPHNWVELL